MSAQTWFVAGTVPLVVAGALHALAALLDAVRPTFFAPVDDDLLPVLRRSGFRLRRMVVLGDPGRPSIWRAWLGFNVSHGLGLTAFGVLALLVALDDPSLGVPGLTVVAPVVAAAYGVLAVRCWFWGPVVITGASTTCFVVAAVLAA